MKINLSGLVLLTGVPGSGKTLRMMEYMEAALKAGRPCYVCNVDGLNVPGAIPFDDPHQWQDLPPTSVLFVDEAQRYFRARRGMIDPPESITAMETIRHDGVCIVMTTQQPTYLDKHIRGLIGHHEHLVEVAAGKISNVYTFRSTRDEVTPASLGDATYEMWNHPKRLHGAYKSAEVHTKKTLIPLRFKALAVFALLTAIYTVYAFMPKSDSAEGQKPAQAAPAAGLAIASGGSGDGVKPLTRAEYAQRHLPRFATMPWTSEVFDNRQVTADPQLICMSSNGGDDVHGQHREPSCTCLTEQGTFYEISQPECRRIARFGPVYNPYKVQQPSAHDDMLAGGVGGSPPTAMASVDAAPSPGAVMRAPQISGYGDIAVGKAGAAP